jgi:hypothetical protein
VLKTQKFLLIIGRVKKTGNNVVLQKYLVDLNNLNLLKVKEIKKKKSTHFSNKNHVIFYKNGMPAEMNFVVTTYLTLTILSFYSKIILIEVFNLMFLDIGLRIQFQK